MPPFGLFFTQPLYYTITMHQQTYEQIGAGYTQHRRADPRIVAALRAFLNLPPKSRIVDIGAGTGNYSQAFAERDYQVIAVEPSAMMRQQAPLDSAVSWLAGVAEALPLANGAADGLMCILALHHFRNCLTAIAEMQRVVPIGPWVILTFDPRLAEPFWFRSYFPTLWESTFATFPPLEVITMHISTSAGRRVTVVPCLLPPNLQDRFAAAGWSQPHLYLDATVRAGMSCFALGDQAQIEEGVDQLRHDLATGIWQRQHADLLTRFTFDAGYRFLIVR